MQIILQKNIVFEVTTNYLYNSTVTLPTL